LNQGEERVSANLKALGEAALKTLVGIESSSEKTPALTEEIYAKLTDDDIRALAAGVAKACDLGPLREGEALEALGAALFEHLTQHANRLAESTAKIKQMLDTSFGSLSETVKTALGDNLSRLSDIRERLQMSPALEAMRKVQEDQKGAWARLSGIVESLKASPGFDAMQKMQEAHKSLYSGLPAIENSLKISSAFETQHKALSDIVEQLSKDDFANSQSQPVSGLAFRNTQRTEIDISALRPTRFEETPLGRATSRTVAASEESARQLQEVVGLVAQMAEQTEKLQTVFLTEVLPQWFKNLKDASNASNEMLTQTGKSLSWAKWALIGSVFVTILMTCWQLWIASEYKLENDAQQKTSESLMRQQLLAAQELNKRLATDSIRWKEELAKLSRPGENLQTPKTSDHVKPMGKNTEN
jgi:hypothetical protein